MGSPRTSLIQTDRILHKSRLIWECREGFGEGHTSRFTDRDDPVTTLSGFSAIRLFDGCNLELSHLWRKLVGECSTIKLTFQSDKKHAIAGLVSRFSSLSSDEYIEGLWHSHIHEGLLTMGVQAVKEHRKANSLGSLRSRGYLATGPSSITITLS
jgi:hypothetical protein